MRISLAVPFMFAIACTDPASDPSALANEGETENDNVPPVLPDDMVEVPAGPFTMGCDGCEDADEAPTHVVELARYFIDRTEVTKAAFGACVDAGTCEAPRLFDATTLPDHPVTSVSFGMAQQFCASLGRRLPTEAEWEKAARGDDGRRFPWGDDDPTCELANTAGCNVDDDAKSVGAHPAGASPYGALDMAGNVWEWTADVYAADAYATGAVPSEGDTRVYRGGSSGNDPSLATTTNRADSYSPLIGGTGLGFRCAM